MDCVLRRIKPSIYGAMYSRFSSIASSQTSTTPFHPPLIIGPMGDVKRVPESDLPPNHLHSPSVTWGVLLGPKEKMTSNAVICSYLRGLGIVTKELETLELPSAVDVMKERIEFLKNVGLTIEDINNYPLMLGCSVRKNMIPVLLYMEEKVGIPRSELVDLVKNCPQLLHSSVIHDLFPVVRFLNGLNLEYSGLRFVIQKYPQLLGLRVEGTPSTTVSYLVSIGVNPRDINIMILAFPYFLGMRVGTVIKPLLDYLISIGLPQMLLARILEKRPRILGYNLERLVKPNIEVLRSFGVREEMLASMIAQYPIIIGIRLKRRLCAQQYFFLLKLSIDPQGFAHIVEQMPQILCLYQSVMMQRIEFLRDRELCSRDIAIMVVRCPQILVQPLHSMKRAYYFFKTEMKRPLGELVDFPHYFTYNLEGRIKPRFEVLRRRRLMSAPLGWFLNCSDLGFQERMSMGHCREMETTGPWFCMGGKVELPKTEILSDDDDKNNEECKGEKVVCRRMVSLQ